MKNMTAWILLVVSVVALVLAGVVLAQTEWDRPAVQAQGEGNTAYQTPHTITVVGQGSVKIKPDIAQAYIGVTVKDDTVRAASSEMKELMDAVLQALRDQGIAEKDMQTSGFSVWAEEQPPGPESSSQGRMAYRVMNQVMVTVRDLDTVGTVLDAAIEAGANNIYGVTFSIDDPGQQRSEARRMAVADAQAKAQELAALQDLQVGDLVRMSEVIGGQGIYYAGGGGGYGGGAGTAIGTAISPGEIEVSLHVEVVYALLPMGS